MLFDWKHIILVDIEKEHKSKIVEEVFSMLKIEHVSKSFGNCQVLNDINVHVNKGDICGLIGKNGAGKTTLMNIISGLCEPDKGNCFIWDEKQSCVVPAQIGYLPDLPSFFDYLSAKEYIDFLLMNTGEKYLVQKRDELLTSVGVPAKAKIGTMSRGMKQRLGVAAALINDPEVILLDEPTSALDPMGRYELTEILRKLKDNGKTILLSTHILADMEKVCDKVFFLHDGQIKKEISIHNLQKGRNNSWEVVFESDYQCEVFRDTELAITKLAECTYLFETTDQKKLLNVLIQIPVNIIHIGNQTKSLDDWFQEVCK